MSPRLEDLWRTYPGYCPQSSQRLRVDEVSGEPRRAHERIAQTHDRVERRGRAGTVELDVQSRPHLAAEVAHRPAQEARSEVEADHERRLRDRLEEQRAVRRAARLRVGRADEPGLEQ